MNNLNLDKYLNIVNEEKIKRGLETYIPLYPILRVDNGKLLIIYGAPKQRTILKKRII